MEAQEEEVTGLICLKCTKIVAELDSDRGICFTCIAAMANENAETYPPTDNGEQN